METINKKKLILISVLYHQNKKRRASRKGKLFMHPITSARMLSGAFITLYSQLREDANKFFNYFRMSMRTFDELISKIENKIAHSGFLRIAITPTERLAVTIRYVCQNFFLFFNKL